MTHPKRAAIDVEDSSTPDVTVEARHSRAFTVRHAVRRAIAPVAVVSLMAATTVLTFVPLGETTSVSVADPQHQPALQRTSRNGERAPLSAVAPSPSISASSTPSASPTPSPSPSPSVAPSSPEAPPASQSTPEPTPTESSEAPEPVATEAPEPKLPGLGDSAGTRWATTAVNLRTGPGTGYAKVTTVAPGRKLTITTATMDGWQQLNWDGEPVWIKASFLTDQEPAPEPEPTKAAESNSSTSTSSSSGSSSASCPSSAQSIMSGLTSRTANVLRELCAAFPGINSYGGTRSGGGSYHSSGQAIDVMITGEAGWDVARWARNNSGSLGIIEVLYSQQIWTAQRSGEGWRTFSDRGSTSANHYDHVHISVG